MLSKEVLLSLRAKRRGPRTPATTGNLTGPRYTKAPPSGGAFLLRNFSAWNRSHAMCFLAPTAASLAWRCRASLAAPKGACPRSLCAFSSGHEIAVGSLSNWTHLGTRKAAQKTLCGAHEARPAVQGRMVEPLSPPSDWGPATCGALLLLSRVPMMSETTSDQDWRSGLAMLVRRGFPSTIVRPCVVRRGTWVRVRVRLGWLRSD